MIYSEHCMYSNAMFSNLRLLIIVHKENQSTGVSARFSNILIIGIKGSRRKVQIIAMLTLNCDNNFNNDNFLCLSYGTP